MPKVKKLSNKGVHVVGRLRDFTGEPVPKKKITISLPKICLWRDSVLVKEQNKVTDAYGRFDFWLPPTSELSTVDGSPTPNYSITCENMGSWSFVVPDKVVKMEIATTGGKHVVSK